MPPVGARHGGEIMPFEYWGQQHDNLGVTLYALLTSKDVIHASAHLSCQVLDQYQFTGNGFQVLQDLICLHHPGHVLTRAPAFSLIRDATPVMPHNVSPQDQLMELTRYYRSFSNWETHISLYPEAKLMRGTDYHLLFINGLTPAFKTQVGRERDDLMVFRRQHLPDDIEPFTSPDLHAKGIFDRLSATITPVSRETRALSSSSRPQR